LFLKFKQIYNKSHINLINTAHRLVCQIAGDFTGAGVQPDYINCRIWAD